MKKLMLACVAACAAAVAFAEKSISLVKVADGRATVTFEGEGAGYQSLVLAYGTEPGGDSVGSWEHSLGVGAVAGDQMSVSVPLPEGWGSDYTNAKFFLYDGIANRSDGYIRDGLAAQWDAIDLNADGTHPQQGVKTWKDLVAGREFVSGQDAVVTERSIRFAADASLDAASSSLLLNSGITTVESMISVYTKSKEMILGTANSGLDWFDYTHLYFVKASKEAPAKGIPWADKPLSTYSAVYDQSQDGAAKLKAAYRNGLDEWNSSTSYWNGGQDCMVIKPTCTLNTLRIYDRRLSEDELKANAAVDTARYVNLSTTDQIGATYSFTSDDRLVSVLPGEHGTGTGGGIYRKGQQVTLTATADEGWTFFYWRDLPAGIDATQNPLVFTIRDDVTVTPVFMDEYRKIDPVVGRSVEISAVEKDDSDRPVAVVLRFGPAADGTDRLDMLYAAWGSYDAGEDIRYWPNVQKVRAVLPTEGTCRVPIPEGWGQSVRALRFFFVDGVTSDCYVKDGLVAFWDAEDNVGMGMHDSEATTWTDRIGGRKFTLHGATVGEKAISFAGSNDSYGELDDSDTAATFGLNSDRTIECSIDFLESSTPEGVALSGPSSSGVLIGPWGSTTYFSPKSDVKTYNADLSTPVKRISLSYDNKGVPVGIFVENKEPSLGGKGGWGVGTTTTTIGMLNKGTYPLACAFYNIRVYNRVLTPDEHLLNYHIDCKLQEEGPSSGALVSCSDVLKSDSDVKGSYTVTAVVPYATVSGAGTYDEGTEITLMATMQEGCQFRFWTGDVPEGVDRTSPTITFVVRRNMTLSARVRTPWFATYEGEGDARHLTAIYNSDVTFEATAADGELTLNRIVFGSVIDEELDLSGVSADTGFRLAAFASGLFRDGATPQAIRIAADELKTIGDHAFYNSKFVRFEPSTLPALETIGSYAFAVSAVSGFLAPNLRTLGEYAFGWARSLTNLVTETLNMPLNRSVYQYAVSLVGTAVIDSPSTEIPYGLFLETSVDRIIVRSPVTRLGDFAFANLLNRNAKIEWYGKAPTVWGELSADGLPTKANAPIGSRVRSSDPETYPQLLAKRDLAGWMRFGEFVPLAQIDDKYKTAQCGWTKRAVGWFESTDATGGGNTTYRCWLIDDSMHGLMLIIW